MDEQDHLVEYLADRNVACVSCGYNLRGIRGGRCPECNEELVLRVGLAEPRLGSVIAFLAGAWCCAGTTFAVLAFFLILSLYFDDWPPLRYWMPAILGFAIAAPTAAWVGTRGGRAWLRQRGDKMRRLLVVGAWLLFFGCIASITLMTMLM